MRVGKNATPSIASHDTAGGVRVVPAAGGRITRTAQSETAAHASLGYPLLLSASNKRFIGELLGREIDDRRTESLAAVAYGVIHGARVVRAHDVRGSVHVCRTIEAMLGAQW